MVHTLSICSLSAQTAYLELAGAADEAWPTRQVVSAAGDFSCQEPGGAIQMTPVEGDVALFLPYFKVFICPCHGKNIMCSSHRADASQHVGF